MRSRVKAETREEENRTRKAREVKAKREAKATEGMRVWDEVDARAKAKISRITTKASERDKIEADVRLRERDDVAKRNTEELGARNRSR